MPSDKKYTITIKIKEKGSGTEKTKLCIVDYDTNGTTPGPIDKNGKPLAADPTYSSASDDKVLEGLDDKNPTWVKIGGIWYRI